MGDDALCVFELGGMGGAVEVVRFRQVAVEVLTPLSKLGCVSEVFWMRKKGERTSSGVADGGGVGMGVVFSVHMIMSG